MFYMLKSFIENLNTDREDYSSKDIQDRIDYAIARGKVSASQAEELTKVLTDKMNEAKISPKSLEERLTLLEDVATEILAIVSGEDELDEDEKIEEEDNADLESEDEGEEK